jgi:hypothetical protein
LTADEWERLIFSWLTGMPYDTPLEARICLGLFGALILLTVVRGGRWAWFFLLQAAVPWLAVVAVARWAGPTIVQERYFALAQIGLFGLWAVAWQSLAGWFGRWLLVLLLCPAAAAGLADYLSRLPTQPPALQATAEWLKGQAVENDLFLIEDYRYVNLFRYYTARAGLPWLHVKAQAPSPTKGHIVHLGSLENSDLYWSEEELWRRAPPRVWLVGVRAGWPAIQTPEGWSMRKREFEGGGGTYVTLVRCTPAP